MIVNSSYHKVLCFRVSGSETITLKPGSNMLEPKQVDALKEGSLFQGLCEKKIIEVVEPPPAPKKRKSGKKTKAEKVEF